MYELLSRAIGRLFKQQLEEPKPAEPKVIPRPPMLTVDETALERFSAINSGEYSNFGLISCYVNGEASSAIVAFITDSNGIVRVIPMFVDITHSMKLEDEHGNPMSNALFDSEIAIEARNFLETVTKKYNDTR